MCGKFSQQFVWRDHVEFSGMQSAVRGEKISVTPMRFASVLHLAQDGTRLATEMRWGFAKKSAGVPGNKPDHIHARAETMDVLPTFRDAFAQRRGLLIVETFNEGKELPGGKTQQHTIPPLDGAPLAIAVLFERWQHPSGDGLYTFVMVTTPPNALIGTITDRMPAIIQPQDWATWLGETSASLAEVKSLLVPLEGDWSMEPEKKPGKAADQPGLFG